MFMARIQLNSNHNPLIGWFLQETVAVVVLSEFKSLHMKHQENFTWLTHSRVTVLQPVIAFLGNIISNFDYQEFLKSIDTLPCGKHARLVHLMHDTL